MSPPESNAVRAASEAPLARTLAPDSGPLSGHPKQLRCDHRQLLDGEWWRDIPGYRDVAAGVFHDPVWQDANSVTKPEQLRCVLGDRVPRGLVDDVTAGIARAPMSVRITPYLLSLIDWRDPYDDPIRRQFLPVGSTMVADHPKLRLDSLGEQSDAAVPGLTHRYPDRALFLALTVCPVYCRFCTRSYAVGLDTDNLSKKRLTADRQRWARAFEHIARHPEIEDIVVSGGDAYRLKPTLLEEICNGLLDIEHVRRIRIATKGLAVLPQKILGDPAWTDALTRAVERGRKTGREVCVHTHFNSAREITGVTREATGLLHERGITVRNQTVLQRGVNDTVAHMALLIKRLAYVNVQPYYVYVHDLVRGAEDMRTTLATARSIEKHVRGLTAGYNTPLFIVDAPGGGGKRDVHSFEHYDRETGISVFEAPGVKPGRAFLYYDPIDLLPRAGRDRWADPTQHQAMIDAALAAAAAEAR